MTRTVECLFSGFKYLLEQFVGCRPVKGRKIGALRQCWIQSATQLFDRILQSFPPHICDENIRLVALDSPDVGFLL
jgi:hypothetical protein